MGYTVLEESTLARRGTGKEGTGERENIPVCSPAPSPFAHAPSRRLSVQTLKIGETDMDGAITDQRMDREVDEAVMRNERLDAAGQSAIGPNRRLRAGS